MVSGRWEPGRPFPNFWRPACSFAFGIFGIFVFRELDGIPGRAGRPGLAARVLVPLGAGVRLLTHPWCPLCCFPGPRAPAPPGSGTPGPALAPWLRRVRSPRRVLSAPAAHWQRIRTHRWETIPDARRPCPNPDPSPPPCTFPHPSTLAPLPRGPGDRLACLHQANGSSFHHMREKAKAGTNSAPFPGEAVGGGVGAGKGGERRGPGRHKELLARRS